MAKQSPKKTKKPVLIVEDDRSIRNALQDLLEAEGYTVVCATNGSKALTLLRAAEQLPGIILLNLMMPVMNGIQFRAEQEQDARLGSIPVILMTADRQIESKRMEIGARGFIKKPFDIADVVKKIERYAHDHS